MITFFPTTGKENLKVFIEDHSSAIVKKHEITQYMCLIKKLILPIHLKVLNKEEQYWIFLSCKIILSV